MKLETEKFYDEQNKNYIYVIINKINNKMYVGQSENPAARWNDHKKAARSGGIYKPYIAIRKYGIENFDFQVIEECQTLDESNIEETKWISFLQTVNHDYGYNIQHGGQVGKMNEETKEKISKIHRIFTDEQDDEIAKLYNQNYPLMKIAEKFDCSSGPIRKALKRKNIALRKGRESSRLFTNEEESQIVKLYNEEKQNSYDISTDFETTEGTILRILEKYNIEINDNQTFDRRLKRKAISEDQEKELISTYLDKAMDHYDLANKYNCSEATIKSYLIKNNIEIIKFKPVSTGKLSLTKEQEDSILKEYNSNKSIYETSKKLNYSFYAIRTVLAKHNVKYRKSQAEKISFSGKDFTKIIDLYVVEELTIEQIANDFKCKKAIIRKALLNNNIELRRSGTKIKLKKSQQEEVCNLYKTTNTTLSALAQKYECSNSTIKNILNEAKIKVVKRGGNKKTEQSSFSIYCIKNKIDNKVFVGITNNPKRIMSDNKKYSRRPDPRSSLHKAIKKDGFDNFEFIEVDNYTLHGDALRERRKWILFTSSHIENYGYNDDFVIGTLSEEHKKKISDFHKMFKTKEEEQKIVDHYNKIKSIDETAKKFDCSTSTISRVLDNNNIKKRTKEEIYGPRKKDVSDKKFSIMNAYINDQKSIFTIAEEIGCASRVIKRLLKENGIEERTKDDSYEKLRKIKKDQIPELIRLYTQERIGVMELAEKYNCDSGVITNILIKNKIKLRTRHEQNRIFDEKQEKIIINDYVNNKLGSNELAIKYNCNSGVILNILYRNNIQARTVKETGELRKSIKQDDEQKIIDYYVKDSLSINDIAKKFNCDGHAVSDVLNKHNIKIKSKGESAALKLTKYTFTEDQEKEIIEQFKNKTIWQLSKLFKCNRRAIRRVLEKYNISH